MTDTAQRFEDGVHTKDNCGQNKHGYAAIGVLLKSTDVHRLGRVLTSTSKLTVSHSKKKTFAYSDTLVYIFMKVLLYKGIDNVYILFLSSGSFLSPTMKRIISALSKMMNILVTVQLVESKFTVTVNFAGVESSQVYIHGTDLLKFFSFFTEMDNTFAIVLPTLTPIYKSVITQCKIKHWCVPSSRSEIYVSKSPEGSHFHNVFPWSKYPCYSGFTIGTGSIELGSAAERNRYIGGFNSYELLVSSTPVGNSCTDCSALKHTAKLIRLLIGDTTVRHKHTLSLSSVEALEGLQRMIEESMQES
jgi:hypothetical protein